MSNTTIEKIKHILFGLGLLCLSASAQAQVYLKPTVSTPTSFVIIVDDNTFSKAEKELLAYKKSVEDDGIGTYIIYHNWNSPTEIRNILKKLYTEVQQPLEGAVFVGDIPIPMLREAQYLTSAFKMSETIGWERSSVPSDRYYDDFDLEFEYLKQDEDASRSLYHYYRIKPESKHYIEMDIYSGRIKPPIEGGDDDGMQQIRQYLRKLVQVKKEKHTLDNMIVSTGHGYNSNSIVSLASEVAAIRSSFSGLFTPGKSIRFLNYRNSDFLKNNLLNELKKDELDFAFLTGHGTASLQLLNGYPDASSPQPSMQNVARYIRSKMRNAQESGRDLEKVKSDFQSSLGLNGKWFEDAFSEESIESDSVFDETLNINSRDISDIQARVVYLNSCLTGSFHLTDYLAGHYPFSGGGECRGVRQYGWCFTGLMGTTAFRDFTTWRTNRAFTEKNSLSGNAYTGRSYFSFRC